MSGHSSDAGDAQCRGRVEATLLLKLMSCLCQASSLSDASLQEQSGYDKKTFMGYIKVSQLCNLTVVMLCSTLPLLPLLVSHFGMYRCIEQQQLTLLASCAALVGQGAEATARGPAGRVQDQGAARHQVPGWQDQGSAIVSARSFVVRLLEAPTSPLGACPCWTTAPSLCCQVEALASLLRVYALQPSRSLPCVISTSQLRDLVLSSLCARASCTATTCVKTQ